MDESSDDESDNDFVSDKKMTTLSIEKNKAQPKKRKSVEEYSDVGFDDDFMM
ncbi:hypothetical protein Tco_0161076, partial [Tanacetum coccineum]